MRMLNCDQSIGVFNEALQSAPPANGVAKFGKGSHFNSVMAAGSIMPGRKVYGVAGFAAPAATRPVGLASPQVGLLKSPPTSAAEGTHDWRVIPRISLFHSWL